MEDKGMNKKLTFGPEARIKILDGSEEVAKAVGVTLGAKGRNVAIYNHLREMIITKDGATVVKHIHFKDQIKDFGAECIKVAAKKTCEQAGDGTTTASLLAAAILKEGMKALASGINPILLKRGIDKAVAMIVAIIQTVSTPVSKDLRDLNFIAKVSANNDEVIGKVIAEAMKKVGPEGIVDARGIVGEDTGVEIDEGFKIKSGLFNRHFIDDLEKMQTTFEASLVLLTDTELTQQVQIKPVLEIANAHKMPLLIIAKDISGEALANLTYNHANKYMKVVAIKAPFSGDLQKHIMDDLSILLKARLVSEDQAINIEDVTYDMLGFADKVIIDKEVTTVVGISNDKERVDTRLKELRSQVKKPGLSKLAVENLEQRIGCLLGLAAVITVGGSSKTEVSEKLDRVEDAIWATRSAIEEGVIPGGGSVFVHAQPLLITPKGLSLDEAMGFDIVKKCIEAPLRKIAENAGKDGGAIVDQVRRSRDNKGWNALTEKIEDLTKSGIIDPTKVARVALENGASAAGMLLTTECVISDSLE